MVHAVFPWHLASMIDWASGKLQSPSLGLRALQHKTIHILHASINELWAEKRGLQAK